MSWNRRHGTAALVTALALAPGSGCGESDPPRPRADCTPTAGNLVTYEAIVTDLEAPVFVTSPPRELRLFVIEQPGRIRIVEDGVLLPTPFLDLTADVTFGGEQGLLGMAFHPDYPDDPRFFVNFSAESSPEGQGATVISEYRVSADPNVADPSGVRLLEIGQFASNHNGGMIAFGRDGYLYIGMGDGGGSGDNDDPDNPAGNGQDLTTLLGDMLRIDVSAPGQYAIPSDNPYADSSGNGTDPRPEIWASGLRNPWRFSFDQQTGDLWIGDVGQGAIEEVSFAAAGSPGGLNFGWREMEGTACFDPSDNCDTSDKTLPVAEYAHSSGRSSVTGGYVYRGLCMPDLQGTYVFGDYGSGEVWGIRSSGEPVTDLPLLFDVGGADDLTSFGEDASGELYFTLHSGVLARIVPAAE